MTVPSSGHGLNVLKADGTLAYSSEYQIMKVIESVEITMYGSDFTWRNPNPSYDNTTSMPIAVENKTKDTYVLLNSTSVFRTTTQVLMFNVSLYMLRMWGPCYYFRPIKGESYADMGIVFKNQQRYPVVNYGYDLTSTKDVRHMMFGELSK